VAGSQRERRQGQGGRAGVGSSSQEGTGEGRGQGQRNGRWGAGGRVGQGTEGRLEGGGRGGTTVGELSYGFYLYKLLGKNTIKLNSEIKAGQSIPFIVLVYKPFVKEKLSFELEEYIKKAQGQIFYIENANELKTKLNELKTKIN
jgi:hypothetical protein